jgi:hypothetical protein
MATFKLGYTAATKTAYVTKSPDALPGGTTDLGTFDHVDADFDTLFHHVRDILNKRSAANPAVAALAPFNIQNMQEIKIVKHGPGFTTEYLTAAAINVADGATANIVIKYQPANVNATATDFTYVSADATKATVSAAGVVTGVAAGTTTVTATAKNGAYSIVIAVTVTA